MTEFTTNLQSKRSLNYNCLYWIYCFSKEVARSLKTIPAQNSRLNKSLDISCTQNIILNLGYHPQVYDVGKEELQLAGVSAMLLASKYEEMYAPEIGDFVYITDNAYNKAQIRKMEALIFKNLNFSVGKPLCLHFLRRNSKAGEVK